MKNSANLNYKKLIEQKLISGIELLPAQNKFELLLKQCIKFQLAENNLTINDIKIRLIENTERVDEVLPALIGAARVAGSLIGKVAGGVGRAVSSAARGAAKGIGRGVRSATKNIGNKFKDPSSMFRRAVKNVNSNFTNDRSSAGRSPQPAPESPMVKKPDVLDQLESIQLQYIEEGFMDFLKKAGQATKQKFSNVMQAARDPKTYVNLAGRAAKGLAGGAVDLAAGVTRDIPFIGGVAQHLKARKDDVIAQNEEQRRRDRLAASLRKARRPTP